MSLLPAAEIAAVAAVISGSGAGAGANAGRTPLVKLALSAVTFAVTPVAFAALYVIRYTAPAVSSDTSTDPSGIGSTSAGRPAVERCVNRPTCCSHQPHQM